MDNRICEKFSRISPTAINKTRRFTNITQILLFDEGYVRNALRYAGAEEKYISGEASDYEKFRELCRLYPLFWGNVAQFVCEYVLDSIFSCKLRPSEENCDEIWRITSDRLLEAPIGPTELFSAFDVDEATLLTDISQNPEELELPNERIGLAVCPDSIIDVGSRGYKKRFSAFETAFGEKISHVSDLARAFSRLCRRFESKGCRSACICGLTPRDFGKTDHYHADLAMKAAVETDGNPTEEEATAFRRYAIHSFLELCRERKFSVVLEFCPPSLEILPELYLKSTVEHRFYLDFSEGDAVLPRPCLDVCSDMQAQLCECSKRYAIGKLPPFFVGTANPAELCLHGLYRSQFEKYVKRNEK